jgi:hypothetical protein
MQKALIMFKDWGSLGCGSANFGRVDDHLRLDFRLRLGGVCLGESELGIGGMPLAFLRSSYLTCQTLQSLNKPSKAKDLPVHAQAPYLTKSGPHMIPGSFLISASCILSSSWWRSRKRLSPFAATSSPASFQSPGLNCVGMFAASNRRTVA